MQVLGLMGEFYEVVRSMGNCEIPTPTIQNNNVSIKPISSNNTKDEWASF